MSMKNVVLCLLLGLCFVIASPGAIIAGDYPDKPITMILGSRPGGSHDLNARVFTSVIPQYLGQPIVLKFMPGGGGQIASAAACRLKPDGYTIFFDDNYRDQLMPQIEDLPYDTTKSLVAICRINYAPAIVFVLPDKPWKSLGELLEYAKKNPGKLKVGHSGKWGSTFTPMVSVLSEAGAADVRLVPYNGGGPLVRGALSGDVDVAPAFPSSLVSLAQAGKIRCLAVLGEKRLKDFPGVPSAKELGFRSIVMSRVIYVPRDTPEDRLQILRQAFAKMQKDKTYLKLINKIGENTEYLDGLEYEKLRIKQKEQYSKLIEKIAGK